MTSGRSKSSPEGGDVDADARRRIDSLARIPEENPNPVLRVASGDLSIEYANPASAALLELWGTCVGSAVPEPMAAEIRKASQGGQPRHVEVSYRERVYELIITPVADCDYLNVYGIDVTERLRAQEKVRELARFPDENPNPVLRINKDGIVIYGNAGAASLLQHWECDVGCPLPAELRSLVERVIAADRSQVLTRAFGGRIFALELSPIRDAGYVNLYGRDVTRERAASQEAKEARDSLERQYEELTLSLRMLDDEARRRRWITDLLVDLDSRYLDPLTGSLDELQSRAPELSAKVEATTLALEELRRQVRKLTSRGHILRSTNDQRVLLVEGNPKRRSLGRLALRGLGLALDVESSIEDGVTRLAENPYELLCFGEEMLPVALEAHKKGRAERFVLMTDGSIEGVLGILIENPFISSVVARSDISRTTTLRSLLVTVQKLLTGDLFGLEKYMSWGVEIQERSVHTSEGREAAIAELTDSLKAAGIRGSLRGRMAMVAEELLMNALYDAPSDSVGRPKFNHLPRSTKISLKPANACKLRWGFDGSMLAVSVEDLFGRLSREVVLEYLSGCYAGRAGELNVSREGKAGAGMGLFQIMSSSDLMVINVQPNRRTEVISLIDIESKDSVRSGSLHFFYD